MIIVDSALERREEQGRPVRVAIIGAGYMGRGIARQFSHSLEGACDSRASAIER